MHRRFHPNGMTPMSDRPMSAALLRRLAETADGSRDNQSRWVVASYPEPTDGKLKSFSSEDQAKAYCKELNDAGGDYGVFGPYATSPGVGTNATGHKMRVKRVAVVVDDGNGGELVNELPGDQYDALFWSASALDKFAVPYYVSMAGLAFGNKVSSDFGQERVYMMAHLPDTLYQTAFIKKVNGGPGGGGTEVELLSR